MAVRPRKSLIRLAEGERCRMNNLNELLTDTNLRGVFLAMKYEVPHLLASGGGNIVVTSSSNAIATTEKRSAVPPIPRASAGL